jgi:hypothetical protein
MIQVVLKSIQTAKNLISEKNNSSNNNSNNGDNNNDDDDNVSQSIITDLQLLEFVIIRSSDN